MLLRRVVTALVLLAVILPALLAQAPWVWPAVSLVFVLIAAWEWVRMLEPARANIAAQAALVGFGAWVLVAMPTDPGALTAQEGGWWLLVHLGCALACLFWCLMAPWQLRLVRNALFPAWSAVLVLAATWLAVLHLHRRGLGELLSGLALVWVADVAAYFVGRRFGRTRLAPRISPGKTREGALGAALAVLCAALVTHALAQADWPSTFHSRWLAALWATIPWPAALLIWATMLLILVGLSIVGDLYESMIKRLAGVKDSSGLLPGHGGVLDRIDALLPVLPALVLIDGWLAWLGLNR